ncbi:MAG: hypothetical protein ACXABY_18800 [Candidatus Thorarchaeota archaeon]|jgi:hypothetical protein
MKLLSEKLGSRAFTKLVSDTAAAIIKEAGEELRDQEISDRSRETRVVALVKTFERELAAEISNSLRRMRKV